jgi:hypothetical protein
MPVTMSLWIASDKAPPVVRHWAFRHPILGALADIIGAAICQFFATLVGVLAIGLFILVVHGLVICWTSFGRDWVLWYGHYFLFLLTCVGLVITVWSIQDDIKQQRPKRRSNNRT